jgi:cytoskeletal protein CcmA (bactofilin family)
MKIKSSILALRLLLAVMLPSWLAASLHAADMRAGEKIKVAAADTVNGNLYTAGSEIEIDGAVSGDLLAAGSTIRIPGMVAHDITMVGGEIDINGKVDGDVRVAGGQVNVAGEITGDLVVAGGTVRLLSGAVIGGEVLLAASELRIEGLINGPLVAAANLTRIEGTIRGPVKVRTGILEFGESATLESTLAYFAPQEAQIPATARITGPIQYEMTSGMDQSWLYGLLRRVGIAIAFLAFGMSLAGGLLGVILLPQTSNSLIQHIANNLGSECLRGFVLFLVMPPIFFILMVTVIGVPVAVLSGMIHLGFGIVSVIYAAVLGGALFMKAVLKRETTEVNWKTVLVGIPLLFLINMIPLVGFLVNTILFLAVFGGIYGRMWTLVRREQPTAPPEGI